MQIPPEFLSRKNELLHPEPFLWLVEVRGPENAPLVGPSGADEILRATANSEKITFDSNPVSGAPLEWNPWGIEIGEISSDSEGNVGGIRLTISSVLGTTMRLFRDNNMLRDHVVLLHLVHRAFLTNPQAKWTIRSTVIDSTVNYLNAEVELASFNWMNFDFPQRTVLRTCGHVYRDDDCGFVGDPGNATLGDCLLTFEACKERGDYEEANGLTKEHPKNFGGAKAAPLGASFA